MDANTILDSLTFKEDNGVAIVTFDDRASKVNTLNSRLMPQFEQIFEQIEKSTTVRAVVLISGKASGFIAGADIEELQNCPNEEAAAALSANGKALLLRLERLKQPVVAAINGPCLGGGLELALACTYRMATDAPNTTLGLPEVMLGLLPGAGGTQRLPRLIGLMEALPMMLTGAAVRPEKALKLGLVDHVCSPAGLLDLSVSAARQLANGTLKRNAKKAGPLDLKAQAMNSDVGRKFILRQALKTVMAKTRGLYPAPKAIIDVVGYGLSHGITKGFEKESKEFGRLTQTPEAKALISLYFAQNDLKKNRYPTPKTKVNQLGVLGAGLMGAGISLVSLQKGFSVRLKDVDQDRLGAGKNYVWKGFDSRVKRKAMRLVDAQATLSRLHTQTDWQRFSDCQLVIEAVFEDIDVKHKVLKDLEAHSSDSLIFASNTSALPISKIAEASKRPDRVLGMHYFSPVEKMPLLEVIVTSKTSDEAAGVAVDVGMRQGKTVIVVKDGPGFYTTRILAPFMDEAAILGLEGVDFYTLDRSLQDFGFPVGPITLIDEVGVDVAQHISHDLGAAFGKRVTSADEHILSELVANKCMGRKSSKGFFLYEKSNMPGFVKWMTGKSKKEINPKALEIFAKYKKAAPKGLASKKQMQERMVFRMLNEAVYCLQDGILFRPLDGDVGAVFGLGFPPFLGGPFRYMDSLGIDKVLATLTKLSQDHGERFNPCPLLSDMQKSGKKFYS